MRFVAFLLLLPFIAGAQAFPKQQLTAAQDSIVARYATRGAERFSYLSPQWQQQLNEGLAQDSTIGDLWQMKAMPLFKTRKYEAGLRYLDKAVRYDSSWLDYRGFIRCIFAKQYSAALEDLNHCKTRMPGGYVMDHPYDLYRALCYLQLNEFDKALALLEAVTSDDAAHDRSHHLRLLYLGVAQMETGAYAKAIAAFDLAIARFPQFSDAYFYKGKCLGLLGRTSEGLAEMRKGKTYFEKGYSINEDNSVYELYPYQVAWRWKSVR
ncbi:MAG: tetratricopeptide repeat protein [Chitinophagaceae bacterium]|nr:MAG: tetratricopeptide repeat protein [Chitinophagaceae bacterium]